MPRPRLADAAALLLVALLVTFAFWEVAVGGRTLTTSVGRPGVSGDDLPPGYGPLDFADGTHLDPGASAWQFEPWAEVVHRELAEGRVPLWNPYQGAGSPLAANMQSAVFDPLLLPVHLHPTPRAWDLTFLSIFVAGAFATYVLGRVIGLGTTASLTGASAFVLSGFFIVYSNNQYIRVYFYLPVLFALVEAVVRSRGLLPVAGLGAAVALVLLAGMPEPSFFVLAASGAFGVYRVGRGPKVVGRWSATLRLAGGGALGLALAAPLLVPFLEYLSASFNLHGGATGLQTDAARRALFWVVPYMRGLPSTGTGARDWVGLAVPMLGVVAVGARPAMGRHRGWFFLCCAAVFLFKQFGVPLVQWIGRLPAADRSIFPTFSLPVIAFCLAMLAAVGVQVIEDGTVRRRRLAAGVALLVVAVLAGVGLNSGAITAARARVLVEQFGIAAIGGLLVVVAAAGLPVRGAVAAAAALIAAEWLVFVPAPTPAAPYRIAVLACAGAGVLALLARRRGVRPVAVIASVAVVAELLLLVPRGAYARLWDPYVRPPWLGLLAGPPGPASGGSRGTQDRVFGLDSKLYPNTAGVFGLQDIRTLDALYVRRYVDYIRTFVEPEFDDRFTGRSRDEHTVPNLEGNPMWDLLGVRHVLASVTTGIAPDGSPPPGRLRRVGAAAGVQVLEDAGPMPRAFLVHRVHRVANQDQAIAYLGRGGAHFADGAVRVEGFDPASDVVVEAAPGDLPGLAAAPGATIPEGRGDARITSYGPDRVVVETTAGRPGVLVLTDVFFPGWKATVNGRPARVLPADVAFRGVRVGAGRSTVVFTYEPASFRVGVGIAGLGLAALSAVAALGLVRRRRRPGSDARVALEAPGAPGEPS